MRILYVTTISLTMNSFFKPHVQMLVDEGHQVDIACNYNDLPLDDIYKSLGCNIYQIDFSRSPLSLDNVKAYKQLKEVVKNGKYDVVHCHTPNASVITRLACKKFRKKNELKVFYTAHGFHFYKGAHKLSWLFFYPVEKICSRYTDKIITINQEDFKLAKKKFYAKQICYVPGVGIDLSTFDNVQIDKKSKRKELGVPEKCFLVLSIGELNENKNHEIVIKAISEMGDASIHYVIAGSGEKRAELQDLAYKLGVEKQVHLLGYRNDVFELYRIADIYVLPSLREGLNVSLMEAMASGLPCIVGKIRGNVDLIDSLGGVIVQPTIKEEFVAALKIMVNDEEKRNTCSEVNQKKVIGFSQEHVLEVMKKVYFR